MVKSSSGPGRRVTRGDRERTEERRVDAARRAAAQPLNRKTKRKRYATSIDYAELSRSGFGADGADGPRARKAAAVDYRAMLMGKTLSTGPEDPDVGTARSEPASKSGRSSKPLSGQVGSDARRIRISSRADGKAREGGEKKRGRGTGIPGGGSSGEEALRLRNKIRGKLGTVRFLETMRDAYTQDAWSGWTSRRVRPEGELEKGAQRLRDAKVAVRELLRRLDPAQGLLSAREKRYRASDVDADGMPAERIICSACGGGDTPHGNDVLVCDFAGCRRCFHQRCHFPPVQDDEVGSENEDWVCTHCTAYVDALEDANFTFGTHHASWEAFFSELCKRNGREALQVKHVDPDGYNSREDEDYSPERAASTSSSASSAGDSSSDSSSDDASEGEEGGVASGGKQGVAGGVLARLLALASPPASPRSHTGGGGRKPKWGAGEGAARGRRGKVKAPRSQGESATSWYTMLMDAETGVSSDDGDYGESRAVRPHCHARNYARPVSC